MRIHFQKLNISNAQNDSVYDYQEKTPHIPSEH